MPATATTAVYPDTARRNRAGGARLLDTDMDRPYAEGTFRKIARGIYTSGDRKGQACVIKWFKGGHVSSTAYFRNDIKAVDKACEIIELFNQANVIQQQIRLNIPDVWECGGNSDLPAGAKVLIEPFIDGFRKLNSNTGWSSSSGSWGRVMQALSHFSYHVSEGQLLLCDLQGGFYSNGAVVTDPAICSRTNSYGLTDMGKDGIYNFFAYHKCNEFCRDDWRKPRRTRALFKPRKGTTMINAQGSR